MLGHLIIVNLLVSSLCKQEIMTNEVSLTASLTTSQDTGKDAYLRALPKPIKQFSDFLGDRPWFAGDNVSRVEFSTVHTFSSTVSSKLIYPLNYLPI